MDEETFSGFPRDGMFVAASIIDESHGDSPLALPLETALSPTFPLFTPAEASRSN